MVRALELFLLLCRPEQGHVRPLGQQRGAQPGREGGTVVTIDGYCFDDLEAGLRMALTLTLTLTLTLALALNLILTSP